MKRTSLSERQLPSYTRGEEIFNMVSHIVGGALGIAYLVLCVIMAAVHKSAIGVVSSTIYGASVITLFTMSSVYHGVRPSMAKKVLQVIDHCTIYYMNCRNIHSDCPLRGSFAEHGGRVDAFRSCLGRDCGCGYVYGD